LAAALSLTARRYAFERALPVRGSAFARFFRVETAALARELVRGRSEALRVRASTGAPGWASVPWLAFFSPRVTRSMRHGLYVVIFINARDERIVLSLQHGAADTLTRLGPVEGAACLRQQAAVTARTAGQAHGFSTCQITLGSDAPLPRGYEAGCALSRSWAADAPDLNMIENDLARMLDIYHRLISAHRF